jgi:hypothetical protein
MAARLLWIALVVAAGCVAADQDDPEPIWVDLRVHLPEDRAALDLPEESGVCACPDPQCVNDWIAEHYGCGLCVQFVCEDGTIGGCVSCPPEPVQ